MSGGRESGKQESGYGSAPRREGPKLGIPDSGTRQGSTKSVALCAPTLDQIRMPTLPKFQLKRSPRLRVPQPCTPACNVAASGTSSDSQSHPNSSILCPGRAVFQVPQSLSSPLRVSGESPPSQAPATPRKPLHSES